MTILIIALFIPAYLLIGFGFGLIHLRFTYRRPSFRDLSDAIGALWWVTYMWPLYVFVQLVQFFLVYPLVLFLLRLRRAQIIEAIEAWAVRVTKI